MLWTILLTWKPVTQSLKGRTYTTEGQGVSDDNWNTWMNNPSLANAEEALSSIRAVFAMWNYMNGIAQYRTDLFDGRRDALAVFDNLYARVRTLTPLQRKEDRD